MDCEKLIDLVQEKKSLWDPRDPQYHNRELHRRLWCDIATLMNSTSASIKVKWQRLRDTHRREVRKCSLPTGSQSQGDSTWRYFNQMNFLEEAYATRAMVGNIPDNTHRDSECDIVHVDVDETEEVHSGPPAKKRNKLAKDRYDEIIQIERAKVEHLQQLRKDKFIKEDDDYHFLMSLLPYVRSVPKQKKLQVRLRLQQVVIDGMEGAEFDSDAPTLSQ